MNIADDISEPSREIAEAIAAIVSKHKLGPMVTGIHALNAIALILVHGAGMDDEQAHRMVDTFRMAIKLQQQMKSGLITEEDYKHVAKEMRKRVN